MSLRVQFALLTLALSCAPKEDNGAIQSDTEASQADLSTFGRSDVASVPNDTDGTCGCPTALGELESQIESLKLELRVLQDAVRLAPVSAPSTLQVLDNTGALVGDLASIEESGPIVLTSPESLLVAYTWSGEARPLGKYVHNSPSCSGLVVKYSECPGYPEITLYTPQIPFPGEGGWLAATDELVAVSSKATRPFACFGCQGDLWTIEGYLGRVYAAASFIQPRKFPGPLRVARSAPAE